MGANAREQIEIAFDNVKAALTSVGANFGNIVKLNNYIVDIGTNIAHYREGRVLPDKKRTRGATAHGATTGALDRLCCRRTAV
jgi:enamine deaminase RidA (YjgF/YER057c/UK114 family)